MAYDNVLVTGGAGFIGSHTVDALLARGAKVWVMDDLSTGALLNLKAWKHDSKLHFTKASVTNRRTVDSLVRKVDAIMHLAAVVSPRVSMLRPELTARVNVKGTLNLLQAAVASGVHRFVYASSAAVYGNSERVPVPENAPLQPMSPYGASKLAAEKYCDVYCRTHGLETVSLRYFNVYGARQGSNPYSGVIAIFASKLRKGQRPIIYGDGNQTRDFIHVSDVIQANLLALEAKTRAGEVVNIGTGQQTTVRELFDLMAQLINPSTRPVLGPSRPGDIYRSCADISKAKNLLGFQPKISIRSGLSLLLEEPGYSTSSPS
jgi:UDP-glucose 4-epimerase